MARKNAAPAAERITEYDEKPFTVDDSTRILKVLPQPGKDDIIVVALSTWKGKQSLDIRTYYETADGWAPGKGARMSTVLAPQIADVLLNHPELSQL